MTAPTSPSTVPLSKRGAAVLFVAAVSYVAWLVLWAFGATAIALGSALSRRPMPREFWLGDWWQWIVAASAAILVLALAVRWRHTRVAAFVWLGSILGLGTISALLIQFNWTVPFSVLLAAAVCFWINRLWSRAA